MLTVLAVLGTVVHMLINAFGAWALQNRRRWIAALFLVTAVLLMISSIWLAFGLAPGAWLATAGLALACASSWLHAQLVMKRVILLNHAIRLLVAALVAALAWMSV